MQALKKNNRGSVLIGAIAISVILAISAAALIGVTRNTHSQNMDAHDDTRAFLAAEGGLYIGTYWYRNAQPQPGPGDFFDVTLDKIPLRVELFAEPALEPGKEDMIRITSTADHKPLPYKKTVEWTVGALGGKPGFNSGYFAYFIDKSDPVGESPKNGVESAYDGFRRSCVFDGPVHFNEPLWMSVADMPVFRSIVSVYNPAPPEGATVSDEMTINGDRAFFYNYGVGKKGNYTKGIKIGAKGHTGTTGLTQTAGIDAIMGTEVNGRAYIVQEEKYTVKFRNPYDASKPVNINPATGVGIDPEDGMIWHVLPKPTSAANQTGSFLKFGIDGTGTTNGTGGTANSTKYTFYLYDGKQWTPKVYSIPQATSGSEIPPMIIYADFPLTVRDGKMKGVVSVRTTDGNNIIFDLKNNPTNGRVLQYDIISLNNVISNIPDKQPQTNSVLLTNFIHSYKGENYGMSEPYLMAFYSGKDIDFETYKTGLKVTITAQIFSKNGQTLVPYGGGDKDCINIIGSCVSKFWWNYSGNANKDERFRVWYDPRIMNAPGVSIAGSEGGDGSYKEEAIVGVFTKIKYKETNTPR